MTKLVAKKKFRQKVFWNALDNTDLAKHFSFESIVKGTSEKKKLDNERL